MYKVYILKSLAKPEITYVGLTTKPINTRITEHNNGLSRYSSSYRPWQLIYYEQFYCQLCATKREKFLKSGVGYKIRKLIADNFEKLY